MEPLCTEELKGNADVVEFCNIPPYLNLLVAASYTLQEGPVPIRVGGLHVFSVERKDENHAAVLLQELQVIDTSGVFDIKWRGSSSDLGLLPCLGQASADGSLRLYSLQEGSGVEKVSLQERVNIAVSSSMCLSLDWCPMGAKDQIALSHSDGLISVVDVGQAKTGVILSAEVHEFETWTTSYDSWDPELLYSGADDSHFCAWDLRQGFDSPVFRNRKAHRMGICSIQSNPQVENALITGSYDENIRLWDKRMMQSPVMRFELGLGGGVWRLKWHPFDEGLILAACMHNGFAVIRADGHDMQVIESYNRHASLAYGADWYKGQWGESDDEAAHQASDNSGTMRSLVATCSFYDKALHVWEP
ncbi:unnamed protein product, partial [Sphagnum tenellum]